MNLSLQSARHLARYWLAYLLAALVIGLLVAELAGATGLMGAGRVSRLGLAPLLVPVLIVCLALWAVGVRLDAARRELEQLHVELERAHTLGRTGNWSYAHGVFEWSARARRILGIDGDALASFEQLLAHVAADDRLPLERALRAAQAGAHYRTEFCVSHPDGERRVLFEGRVESAGARTAGGAVTDMPVLAGIVQDMTDRWRMERELHCAMRYQRALLDNFPFMVWLKDRDLRFLAVNKPLALAGGLNDPDEACGLQDHDLWPTDCADAYRADDLEVLDSRQPRCSESFVASGAGSICLEVWKAPVLDENGELLGTVGFARDISERKRSEQALERSREQLAMLGRLQARFIRGESGEALFAAMLDILLDLAGASDGFIAEVMHDPRYAPQVNLLACRDNDWLGAHPELIDEALTADRSDQESGAIVALAAFADPPRQRVCFAVMSDRRLVGLVGLELPHALPEARRTGVQAAISTFGLILQAGIRDRDRQRAETELKRHRDRLSELIEEQLSDSMSARRMAETANRAKSRFLASMSHELRTPIHAILAFSRLALRDRPPLADVTRRRFEVIREHGDRLLALVDDLLDLSRLEGGAIKLNASCCDLESLVAEAIAQMQAVAVERGVRMRMTGCVPQRPLQADVQRMAQVLRTLLDNAIRFSPPSAEVLLSIERHDHEGAAGVLLRVSDHGPGIAEEDRERIFDQFEQAARLRGSEGGTGLGLAICREIVNLHGGWIRAAERDDCGACIEIWLATREPDENSTEPMQLEMESAT
ncbi:sensory box protein [Methyloversatilis sp. RAC08]|uniref:sensor histidine kinase n=1 Tax=Methyloversatilis sp. RAC08 TaxID=1842540 RepID=UPI00083D96E6|nr:ATP-binding protein [Methyloversatilis sp. RAC08]AOF80409.1 sensory box protein [Methyloversatilis sp. RAC08]